MRWFWLLLWCYPPAWAQSADSVARIEGRVINAVTGEPLRKATASIGDYSATTDASGKFAIEKIPPGNYSLAVEHQNFAGARYGSRMTLSAGQSLTGIELKMTPFGVISGKVLDTDGDPVSGVQVSVMRWGYMRGGRRLVNAGPGASTDDRGMFRVYNLASGRYFLVAHPTGSVSAYPIGAERRSPPQEMYVTTYYPSGADSSGAAAILVSAGQEAPGMDIQLRRTKVVSVSGRVSGMQSGTRYSISLVPKDQGSAGGASRGAVVRQEDSTFTLHGVSPGTYWLLLIPAGHVTTKQELVVGESDIEGLTVPVLETSTVKGKIILPASTESRGLRLTLQPTDFEMFTPSATPGPDGNFTLDQVTPDRYRVTCFPPPGTYLKTVRWNNEVSNDQVIEVSGGGGNLELTFEATTAQIEGDVKTADDQTAAGVRVLLIPDSRRASDFRLAMTDQNGHYLAKAVAPGAYTAVALETPTIGEMPDAELMKALAKDAVTVSVDENAHATAPALKVVSQAQLESLQ